MAVSFLQKIRLGMRGWSRRRAAEAAKRDAEFVAREASWGSISPPPAPAAKPGPAGIDLEGLQVAYLDDSGQIDHYFDIESGEVIEFRSTDLERRKSMDALPARYRRIPTRSEASEAADRTEFVKTLENQKVRLDLEAALMSHDPAGAFRQALSRDRTVERSWYNFKNRRAAQVIELWLSRVRSGNST